MTKKQYQIIDSTVNDIYNNYQDVNDILTHRVNCLKRVNSGNIVSITIWEFIRFHDNYDNIVYNKLMYLNWIDTIEGFKNAILNRHPLLFKDIK
jgi:hypothetical protein